MSKSTTNSAMAAPATRKKLHHRAIHCQGFEREDGLWDIEAELVDTKTYAFANRDRGEITPGVPIHEMRARLTLDLDMRIRAVECEMAKTPFNICPGAEAAMQNLVGLKIGRGWMREARTRMQVRESCTHLFELLRPLATTAYQTMHLALQKHAQEKKAAEGVDGGKAGSSGAVKAGGRSVRPPILDRCYALASDSAVVKREWPEWYSGEGGERGKEGE